MIERRPARAGLAVDRLARNRAQGLFGEREIDRLHLEQALVLLTSAFFG
jgi:hypothetical protein